MTQEQPVVIVVDDDPSIRKAIDRLLRSVGLRVELFESAQEFLQSNHLTHRVALCWMSACRAKAG